MNAIEKARDIIAMGENYADAWAKYEEMTTPGDLLPLLRLLVECEEGFQEIVKGPAIASTWEQIAHRTGNIARAILAKLRSES